MRQALRDSTARLPPDRRVLVPALVDGDDAGLDPVLVDDFRTTGLTHLLAVSGTILTLVVGFLLVVARWLRVRGRWLYVVGAAGIVGFVLLARAEPSVLRAAVMGTVALVGLGSNGTDRGTRALSVATVVLLLVDPGLASSVGFALSVLATAGILLLAPGWRDALGHWLPRWLAEAVAVPAAAQLACTPLIAAISGQVSLVAVAANLLAAPAVGPATVLGLVGGALTLVWAPPGQLVATVACWFVGWIVTVARHGAALPTAAIGWGSGPVALAVLTGLSLVVAMAAPRLLRRRTTAVACAAVLALTVLVRLPTPGWPPEGWLMVMCDVGHQNPTTGTLPSMNGTPTAIYVRMSKDKEGSQLGIQRQEAECRSVAASLKLEVIEVYRDNDLSASKGKARPNYERMLGDIRAGRIRAVVTWHPDRLTRRTSELESYISITKDVPTYTVTAGTFDLTTPSGRATARTVGAWAQAEVEQKALRQVAKNKQMAEAGERIPGGPVPFGYDDRKHLSGNRPNPGYRKSAHPLYGELVRQAYADALAGKGLNGIAADWQKAGAPVPQSASGRWDRASVKRVLLRVTNAGRAVHQGRVLVGVEGRWEPLVDVGTFYAVQSLLLDPARRTSPGATPRHLLSGIGLCSSCGHRLRRQKVRRNRQDQPDVYACTNSRALRGDCAQPITIRVDHLDEYVTDRVLDECGDHEVLSILVQASTVGALAAAVAVADARVRAIAAQFAEPDADVNGLVAALESAKTEREEVATQEAMPYSLEHVVTMKQAWDEPQDGLTLIEHRRGLLRQHVEHLAVRPVGRGRWRQPIADRVELAFRSRRQPVLTVSSRGNPVASATLDAVKGEGMIGAVTVEYTEGDRRMRIRGR